MKKIFTFFNAIYNFFFFGDSQFLAGVATCGLITHISQYFHKPVIMTTTNFVVGVTSMLGLLVLARFYIWPRELKKQEFKNACDVRDALFQGRHEGRQEMVTYIKKIAGTDQLQKQKDFLDNQPKA